MKQFSVKRLNELVWKREDLAKETGLSMQAIWLIETGKRIPGSNNLAKIADALKMPIDYFYEDVE